MILQALVHYYEMLLERGEIVDQGWANVGVTFVLCLNERGELEQVIDARVETDFGKKKRLVPQKMVLPAPVKRSSGIKSNFLCDNATYMLGADIKGKPEHSVKCFSSCAELHRKILADVESPEAEAIRRFFDSWQPENAAEHPCIVPVWKELVNGGNLVFMVNGRYVHEIPEIKRVWRRFSSENKEGANIICLVTGEEAPIARLHPIIKGLANAQSSGASLVSFNAPAFCSFQREQGFNAPTSEYAAFAYTTVLNRLLADKEHVFRLGDDLTIVFWAENADDAYRSFYGSCLSDESPTYSSDEIRSMIKGLASGKSVQFNEENLDPEQPFYILGLSPNAARVSVRFFLRNSFGEFIRNMDEHQERLKIVKSEFDTNQTISLWRLLNETVNQNSKNKSPSPELAGEVLKAVLMNTRYPSTLLNSITLRIRADRKINRVRAAAIKAFYLKNPNKDVPKEVLTVSLNESSTNIPYALGQLFSVYEQIQQAANPKLNATIKDKYFNSASATPAVVFAILGNLASKHLHVIKREKPGLAAMFEHQIGELSLIIGESFPPRMNLPQQGAFQLGYYHRNVERYIKKENKTDE